MGESAVMNWLSTMKTRSNLARFCFLSARYIPLDVHAGVARDLRAEPRVVLPGSAHTDEDGAELELATGQDRAPYRPDRVGESIPR